MKIRFLKKTFDLYLDCIITCIWIRNFEPMMYILGSLSPKTGPQSKLSTQFLYAPLTQFQLFDLKSRTK